MRIVFALIAFSFSLLLTSTSQAQSPSSAPQPETRPRLVETQGVQAAPAVQTRPQAASRYAEAPQTSALKESARATVLPAFSPAVMRARIAEAERLLKSRPRPTSLATPVLDVVTLAVLDRNTSRLHLLPVSKHTFLTKGAELALTTSLGTPVTLRVLRANGVNTAVMVLDNTGRSLAPLVVEFPIERGGLFREMAYYTSAHPALLSPDLVRSGQAYVRSMIDLAAKRLRERGLLISPNIVDVAEHLCLVEHIDHDRFRIENRKALFDEIYSLYALNELETYRYSVSFAGAGGMVQMIPWAYNLERQRHPGAGLMPDFVGGMRNHANALQAMLLYMQDTWNELAAKEEIKTALDSKIASPTELLAAGYNSNAAKLPLYLKRGGSSWRTLIPRETQTYLQIYHSVESLVPMNSRANAVTEALKE